MTLQTTDDQGTERNHQSIAAAAQVHRSFGRQMATSAGGVLALVGIGLVLLIVVLWKAR